MSTERADIKTKLHHRHSIGVTSYSAGNYGRSIQLTQLKENRGITIPQNSTEKLIAGMFDTVQMDEEAVKELIIELQKWVFEK